MAKRKSSSLQPAQLHFGKIFSPERMQRLAGIGLLRRRWHEIVGPLMAARCEPLSLDPQHDGSLTLMIAVDHPVIAQQIRFLYEDIRTACLKQCSIQRLARVYSRVHQGAGMREKQAVSKIIHPVAFADLRGLAQTLQDVEDKAIRRMMFQARISQFKYKK